MFQFIITNIFMVSLGVMLYVAIRTLPRIEENLAQDKKVIWERWLASEMPEKLDRALNGFLLKFLRRLKIVLLKIDNSLAKHLRKVHQANGNGTHKPQIDFRAINEEKAIEKNSDLGDNHSGTN